MNVKYVSLYILEYIRIVLHECEICKFVYTGIHTKQYTSLYLLLCNLCIYYYVFHIHITQSVSIWDPTMH